MGGLDTLKENYEKYNGLDAMAALTLWPASSRRHQFAKEREVHCRAFEGAMNVGHMFASSRQFVAKLVIRSPVTSTLSRSKCGRLGPQSRPLSNAN